MSNNYSFVLALYSIDRDFYIENLPALVELCMTSEGQIIDSKGHILAKYRPEFPFMVSEKKILDIQEQVW